VTHWLLWLATYSSDDSRFIRPGPFAPSIEEESLSEAKEVIARCDS
jgi:hypothetical protein